MRTTKLYKHQKTALALTADKNRVAYYHDMGLGKTFTGAEKMNRLGGRVNLVICQKSKIDDWKEHFEMNYPDYDVFDLSKKDYWPQFIYWSHRGRNLVVGVINYDLIFRRPELLEINFDTLLLDESSMIKNDTAKRTKTILKLKTDNVILLSGTPTGGKYEELYSQLKLLGWKITKTQYWSEFIKTRKINAGGFSIPIVTGYKNVGRLKRKMREYGCDFLTYEQAVEAYSNAEGNTLEALPPQTFTDIKVDAPKEYKQFVKNKIVEIDGRELIGDTTLTQMLYARQLCGAYAAEKVKALGDLIESTNDRLIVFYNFNIELNAIKDICKQFKRPVSQVNGSTKDLDAYEKHTDSVTAIQYQSGAKGLNLQKANKIIYFAPTLSLEDYMQSIKRIHRIGQKRPCFYYRLICKNSIEEKIYKSIENGIDYTEKLFLKG